jgi:heme exporter protein D
LAKTDLTSFKVFQSKEINFKGIKALQSLVESIDRNMDEEGAIKAVVRKKEILIQLLEQTDRELEGIMKSCSNYPILNRERSTIDQEEKILKQVLERTTRERALVEGEKRDDNNETEESGKNVVEDSNRKTFVIK